MREGKVGAPAGNSFPGKGLKTSETTLQEIVKTMIMMPGYTTP